MKKILSLLMVVLMAFAFMPWSVFADENENMTEDAEPSIEEIEEESAVNEEPVVTDENESDMLSGDEEPSVDAVDEAATDNGSVDIEILEKNGQAKKSDLIPSDALEYNGHYYYIYTATGYSDKGFQEAIEDCESLGGHLATISDEKENAALFDYMEAQGLESAYFGLTDYESEGTWRWVNGEPVEYENWAGGEPNNSNGTEHYAMFYWKFTDGTWNDGDFDYETDSGGRSYICEWDDGDSPDNLIGYGFNIPEDTNSFAHHVTCFYYGEEIEASKLKLSEKALYKANHKGIHIENSDKYLVLTDEYSSKEKSYTYPTSDKYYKLLTKGATAFEKAEVKVMMNTGWKGSCRGMAITMALASQGIKKEEFGITGNYNSLGFPKDNRKLRNAINFYQLSQFVGWGDDTHKTYSPIWSTYVSTYTLHAFLTDLVDECKKSNKLKKPFIFDYGVLVKGGHSVVAYGMTENSDGTYTIHMYDMNGHLKMECNVNLSEDTISFTDGKSNNVNKWNYRYFSYTSINDLYGRVKNNTKNTAKGGKSIDHVGSWIALSADKKCVVRTDDGRELRFNGEEYSGDMDVYDCDVKGEGENQTIYFDVDPYDELTVTDMDPEMTVIGELDGEYYNATVDGADSVVFTDGRIELKGDEYSFTAATSAGVENDNLYIVSADASGDVSLTSQDGKISAEAENNMSNAVVTECSGVDSEYTEVAVAADSIEIDTANDSGEITVDPASSDNESPEVKLSATDFTYKYKVQTIKVGKKKKKQAVATVQKPSVTVSLNGKTLSANNYDLTWSNEESAAIGAYTVTATLKGPYSGSAEATYRINPKAVNLKKVAKGKKKFTASWKKLSKNDIKYKVISGYELRYSTDPEFATDVKTVGAGGVKAAKKAISKLQPKTTYYVQLRTYKTVGGTKFYSAWSTAKKVVTK